jgi:hypothetical protein
LLSGKHSHPNPQKIEIKIKRREEKRKKKKIKGKEREEKRKKLQTAKKIISAFQPASTGFHYQRGLQLVTKPLPPFPPYISPAM